MQLQHILLNSISIYSFFPLTSRFTPHFKPSSLPPFITIPSPYPPTTPFLYSTLSLTLSNLILHLFLPYYALSYLLI